MGRFEHHPRRRFARRNGRDDVRIQRGQRGVVVHVFDTARRQRSRFGCRIGIVGRRILRIGRPKRYVGLSPVVPASESASGKPNNKTRPYTSSCILKKSKKRLPSRSSLIQLE